VLRVVLAQVKETQQKLVRQMQVAQKVDLLTLLDLELV